MPTFKLIGGPADRQAVEIPDPEQADTLIIQHPDRETDAKNWTRIRYMRRQLRGETASFDCYVWDGISLNQAVELLLQR